MVLRILVILSVEVYHMSIQSWPTYMVAYMKEKKKTHKSKREK